ncbi:MAG TPA: hypothetical protein DD381_07065 [Lentisphaeria bacterium]|nr:MAG: hypothetical protein A2X47_10840 [Lentisphaerae bacterium GWF2_38_69]HBM16083.1 hypothetical protein [Lentisphaeria bacterium]
MIRILVIDNSENYRYMLKAVLGNAGFGVIDTNNAFTGLEVTRKYFINMVLIDPYMPQTDGMQTIAEFKKEFPGLRIIAMAKDSSGEGCKELLNIARDCGAWDVFKKGENVGVLLQKINALLS